MGDSGFVLYGGRAIQTGFYKCLSNAKFVLEFQLIIATATSPADIKSFELRVDRAILAIDDGKTVFINLYHMVRGEGIEPPLAESKAAVLTVGRTPKTRSHRFALVTRVMGPVGY